MMNTGPIHVIKADGTKELFEMEKLEQSLRHAGASTKVVNDILSHISDTLIDGLNRQKNFSVKRVLKISKSKEVCTHFEE